MKDGPEETASSVVGVDVLDERIVGSSFVRVLRVRDESESLAGHFPGSPVVPGIVQIQWAIDAAGRLAGRMVTLRRLERLKFKAVVRPGQRVEVAVTFSAEGDAIQFRIAFGQTIFSSGRCVLHQAVQPIS
jgi:3-hydroxymyristoyl/3-hydroxydecanoyl-(acyl carrier protein) dehydratase